MWSGFREDPGGSFSEAKDRVDPGIRRHIRLLIARLYLALSNREEQIIGTQEKPQRIVVQRPLSRLQHLDSTKSSAKDLPLTPFNLCLVGSNL